MIDLKELIRIQGAGDKLLGTLTHDDMVIMQNYCLLSAQGLLKAGHGANQSTTNIVLNAYRNGICLGLGLKVSSGQVQGR